MERSDTSLNYTKHNFLVHSRCSVSTWKWGLIADSWKKSTGQRVNEVFFHWFIYQIFIRCLLCISYRDNEISLKIHVFFYRIARYLAWLHGASRRRRLWKNEFLVSFHIHIQHTAQPTGENTDENSLCLISVIKMRVIKPKTQKGEISWVLIDYLSQEQ